MDRAQDPQTYSNRIAALSGHRGDHRRSWRVRELRSAGKFEREHIPCFIDRKQSVLMNPLCSLCACGTDMRWITGFRYEACSGYLRTGGLISRLTKSTSLKIM